jgi:hypothetical protein
MDISLPVDTIEVQNFDEHLREYQDQFNVYRSLVNIGKELKRLLPHLSVERQQRLVSYYKIRDIYSLREELKIL